MYIQFFIFNVSFRGRGDKAPTGHFSFCGTLISKLNVVSLLNFFSNSTTGYKCLIFTVILKQFLRKNCDDIAKLLFDRNLTDVFPNLNICIIALRSYQAISLTNYEAELLFSKLAQIKNQPRSTQIKDG